MVALRLWYSVDARPMGLGDNRESFTIIAFAYCLCLLLLPIAYAYCLCLLRCLFIALVALEAPRSGEELAEDEAAAESMVASALPMQPVLRSRPHTMRGWNYLPIAYSPNAYSPNAYCLLPNALSPIAFLLGSWRAIEHCSLRSADQKGQALWMEGGAVPSAPRLRSP